MSSLAKGGFRKFYWLYDLFESAVQVSTSYIKSVYVVPRHKIILFIAKRHCHIFLTSVLSQVDVTEYWTSVLPWSNILSPTLDCSLMTNMWLLYFDKKIMFLPLKIQVAFPHKFICQGIFKLQLLKKFYTTNLNSSL